MHAKYSATNQAVLSLIGSLAGVTVVGTNARFRRSLRVMTSQIDTAKTPRTLHIPDANRHPLDAFIAMGPVTAADTVLPNESAVA